MGIHKDDINLLKTALEAIGMEFKGLKMCELGNQRMRYGKHKTGKRYFEHLGVYHTSIDLNGKDGAVAYDLSKPILMWEGKFDMVTDFGTSEHVEGQRECFRNIHNFCRVGGVMVHAVPMKGTYAGHSPYHYDREIFDKLALDNNYEVVLNEIRWRSKTEAQICAVLKKI